MRFPRYLCLIPAGLLAACAVGPDYVKPVVDAPPFYKESGAWQQATPADDVPRGAWWEIFHDGSLNGLEAQVALSNQNVKAFEAAYRQAQALTDEARASWFPTLTLNGSDTRAGSGSAGAKAKPTYTYATSVAGSWTADVWGRIDRTVESSTAQSEASAADLANALLSAQITLATDYLNLHWQDEQIKTLQMIVDAYQKLADIEKSRYEQGTDAKTAWLAAEESLEAAKAARTDANITRDKLEHAIAVLVGMPSSEISLPPKNVTPRLPHIPPQIPSTLLQQRPDIAASERAVAAANAQIGVATSAWFPTFSFNASYGYSGIALPQLLQSPYSLWSFGPALAQTLYDGGYRAAAVEEARAAYDQAVANYRQTALTAFQEVEDNLSALHHLSDEAKQQQANLGHARSAEAIAKAQLSVGSAAVSDVLTAHITALKAQQNWQLVQQQRYDATVLLIQALGGTWSPASTPAHKPADKSGEQP